MKCARCGRKGNLDKSPLFDVLICSRCWAAEEDAYIEVIRDLERVIDKRERWPMYWKVLAKVAENPQEHISFSKSEWLHPMKYIREKYGVPIKRGARIKINIPGADFDGTEGRVTSAKSIHDIRVRLDGWGKEPVSFGLDQLIFLDEEG